MTGDVAPHDPLSGVPTSSTTRPSWLGRRMPWVVALLATVAVLGPALGRGVVVSYDMPWSPTPRLTPFALGIGTPAPRAVPGDAVITVLGLLLGAGPAQVLVLGGSLVAAGVGVAFLLRLLAPTASPVAVGAATLAGIWNPFVVERLVIGQWVTVMGYAVVPWALAALLRVAREPAAWLVPAGSVALASAGGANPWAMVVAVLVPGLVVVRARWTVVGVTAALAAGSAAVWALPALTAGVSGDPAGAGAFAPRSDTAYGVVLSLVSGGAFWNPASHPFERQSLVIGALVTGWALVCGAFALRRLGHQRPAILVPVGLSTVIAVAGAVASDSVGWSALIGLPGGGLLRDGQKFIGPWVVLLAVGAGLVVERVARQAPRWPAAVVLAGGVAVLPVALLPSAAWGIGGRLSAAEVPVGLREGAAVLSKAPPGVVGVLPWNQYRRYAWNDHRISLTLLPRMVDQVTLFDDSLPMRTSRIVGEDPRAAAVSAAIAGGQAPAAALVAAGVGYVAVERGGGLAADEVASLGTVIVDNPDLVVIRVDSGPSGTAAPGLSPALRVGWAITSLSWILVVLAALVRAARALPGKGLRPIGRVLRKP